ncbi:MAG: hypothetical protein KJ712_08585 [Bacteroidetes bacterium]|nr:hypothetical protein [Bacteroidota bacterium]
MLLRYVQCFSAPSINYQFLLHAHSHFAFAGWMFLSIALLVVHNFNAKDTLFNKHFKSIFLITLLVSFGMLLSFFLIGYKSFSILLSTLFIFVGYWFVFVTFKSKTFNQQSASIVNLLLKGSLIFLVVSSIGPFALGYLKASGFKNHSLQQNAIYFYLHFQLNGFMQLALLGLFFKNYLKSNMPISHVNAFWTKVLMISTLPLYAMFTLWTHPSVWVYILTFLAALAHLLSWLVLILRLKADLKPLSFLTTIALIAICLQFVFQMLIAIPAIGNWVFESHNLIIGYIHLLTLGSLSPLIIDLFIKAGYLKSSVKLNYLFVTAILIYLVLLFGSAFLGAFQIYIPHLNILLFASNLALPFIGLGYFLNINSTVKIDLG